MSLPTEAEREEREEREDQSSVRVRRDLRLRGLLGLAIGLAVGYMIATVLAAFNGPADMSPDPAPTLAQHQDRWDEGWPIEVGYFQGSTFWAGTQELGSKICVWVSGEQAVILERFTCGDAASNDNTAMVGETRVDPITGQTTTLTFIVVLGDDGDYSFTVESDTSTENPSAKGERQPRNV